MTHGLALPQTQLHLYLVKYLVQIKIRALTSEKMMGMTTKPPFGNLFFNSFKHRENTCISYIFMGEKINHKLSLVLIVQITFFYRVQPVTTVQCTHRSQDGTLLKIIQRNSNPGKVRCDPMFNLHQQLQGHLLS